MTRIIEIKIPDIGDFKDVPIIEILVAPGDTVEKETALVTLETDKASMEIPSPQAGQVNAIQVKVGDKVSEGSVLLTLAVAEASVPIKHPEPTTPVDADPAKPAIDHAVSFDNVQQSSSLSKPTIVPGDIHADVAVIGAGPDRGDVAPGDVAVFVHQLCPAVLHDRGELQPSGSGHAFISDVGRAGSRLVQAAAQFTDCGL